MMEFRENIENDFNPLEKNDYGYFNISDYENRSDRNININNKSISPIMKYIATFFAILGFLFLVKFPVNARVELRKEMLEKSLSIKRSLNESKDKINDNKMLLEDHSTSHNDIQRNSSEKVEEHINSTGPIPHEKANVFSNSSHYSKEKLLNAQNFNEVKDLKKVTVNAADSIFGSHYTPSGINRRAADNDICNDKDYTKKVLKLVYELSYFALPKDTKNIRKFEASDVKVFNEEMWVVCDNSWTIGKFGLSLTPFSSSNKLLGMQTTTSGGNPLNINKLLLGTDPNKEDSQWEAIVKDDITGHLFVIRESIPHDIGGPPAEEKVENSHEKSHALPRHYHSHIIELALVNVNNVESYEVLETCTAEHKFEFDNKGFEGAIGLRTRTGEFYLLGLCEGNFCMGETKGEEYGNGRLILMKKEYLVQNSDPLSEREKDETVGFKSNCIWKSIRVINIPKEANFQDYSSIDVRGSTVAITSQEDSSLWLGEIDFGDGEYLDPDKLELSPNGRVLYFPRDHVCDFKYCNIEGVSFISDNMIATVSDKMKKRNRQSSKCLHKDQSIHIFAIP
ncbi:hypothetical protein HWI79_589 [Cryptosporidium felis]|nr:hypothetical protein HWI79_589 [Cryptosporidium felis]